MAKFTLTSSHFADGATIPNAHVFSGMGLNGGNVSPALNWSAAPAGTKSFALMVFDPDAPTGSGWWHWVVYNIPASTSSLPAGAGDPQKRLMPAGAIQGRTDYGSVGYGGPAPPPGPRHRYQFHLHALDVEKLDVPADATAAMIGFNVRAHTLAEAVYTGLYGR